MLISHSDGFRKDPALQLSGFYCVCGEFKVNRTLNIRIPGPVGNEQVSYSRRNQGCPSPILMLDIGPISAKKKKKKEYRTASKISDINTLIFFLFFFY